MKKMKKILQTIWFAFFGVGGGIKYRILIPEH